MCARDRIFSAVIPAHNGEEFLHDTIHSVISQTRPFDEIVVVDDASTDGTRLISTAPELQGRVKYVFNSESTGFVDAWNRSVQYASGDFVTILHQDDLLHSSYLEIVEGALTHFPAVEHIYSGCNYIDGSGKVIRSTKSVTSEPSLYAGKQYAHNYLMGVLSNQHIHRCPGVTTGRDVLLHRCMYRKEAGHIADDDFFLRVGAFTDVVGISAPLASYREHRNSETGRLDLLSYRLAQDYLFQSRYYRESEALLDEEDIACIHRQAVRFINLFLFQALVLNNRPWVSAAINLRKEFDALFPGAMEMTLPLWANGMWKLIAQPQNRRGLARPYAHMIGAAISLRDTIKRLKARR